MRLLSILALSLSVTGCAQMLSTVTPEQIQQSQYRAELESGKPATALTLCMKEALYTYRDDRGRAPYTELTSRDLSQEQELMLRNPHISMIGAEILFMIKNEARTSGSKSTVWANPMLLGGGGSQAYLNKVVAVVRPCV